MSLRHFGVSSGLCIGGVLCIRRVFIRGLGLCRFGLRGRGSMSGTVVIQLGIGRHEQGASESQQKSGNHYVCVHLGDLPVRSMPTGIERLRLIINFKTLGLSRLTRRWVRHCGLLQARPGFRHYLSGRARFSVAPGGKHSAREVKDPSP